jgi:3-deoxy-manno-octulosonate cytidylyltransferase (CMP-KDO synthetase)
MIGGKPMIRRVYERAREAVVPSRVLVATDDSRIARAVEDFGGEAALTSPDHRTGTERVAEIARATEAACYVNVQGDEPLIDPAFIDAVARAVLAGAPMATLATRIVSRGDLFDQNVVKVILSRDSLALYFSRHAVPFPRKYLERGEDIDLAASVYLRHVGTYAYSRAALLEMAGAEPCEMEQLESLEQLRALFLGVPIKVEVVESSGPCVDVPGDIAKVERIIAATGAR